MHADPQRILAIPGRASAGARALPKREDWAAELLNSSSSLDETVAIHSFNSLAVAVAKAQGRTTVTALFRGRLVDGDDDNLVQGRFRSAERVVGAVRNAFEVEPNNVVFGPDAELFTPCRQQRVLQGNRLQLKEDAAGFAQMPTRPASKSWEEFLP